MKILNHHKFCLYVVTSVIIFTCCFFWSSKSSAISTEDAPGCIQCYESVLIHKGDTLWSIAESNLKNPSHAEIQAYADEIASLNQISASRIHAGKYLILPIYG